MDDLSAQTYNEQYKCPVWDCIRPGPHGTDHLYPSNLYQSQTNYEKISHPHHYGGDTPYEAIKVIEAWRLDFCLGNAVKYITRAGKKPDTTELEDLEKAQWYIQRRIDQLKGKTLL